MVSVDPSRNHRKLGFGRALASHSTTSGIVFTVTLIILFDIVISSGETWREEGEKKQKFLIIVYRGKYNKRHTRNHVKKNCETYIRRESEYCSPHPVRFRCCCSCKWIWHYPRRDRVGRSARPWDSTRESIGYSRNHWFSDQADDKHSTRSIDSFSKSP